MESATHLLAEQIDQEYAHILQIAQHMTVNGMAGKQVNEILRAQTVYDLGEAKRALSVGLQTITAIGNQIELALYYSPSDNEIFATTFSPAICLDRIFRDSHFVSYLCITPTGFE